MFRQQTVSEYIHRFKDLSLNKAFIVVNMVYSSHFHNYKQVNRCISDLIHKILLLNLYLKYALILINF